MSPIVSILLTLLQTIAGIATSKTGNANVTMLLNLVTDAIKLGDAAYGALVTLNSEVNTMVTGGKEPTQSQWDALKARSDAAHATIQGN